MAAAYGELRTGTAGSHPRWQRNRRKPPPTRGCRCTLIHKPARLERSDRLVISDRNGDVSRCCPPRSLSCPHQPDRHPGHHPGAIAGHQKCGACVVQQAESKVERGQRASQLTRQPLPNLAHGDSHACCPSSPMPATPQSWIDCLPYLHQVGGDRRCATWCCVALRGPAEDPPVRRMT